MIRVVKFTNHLFLICYTSMENKPGYCAVTRTVIVLDIFETGVTSIYNEVKVVRRNRSDNHRKQSDIVDSCLYFY